MADSGAQTTRLAHVETQTEPEEPLDCRFIEGKPLDHDTERSLAKFLRLVEPLVSQQLWQNVTSHAFDGYAVAWEEPHADVQSWFELHQDGLADELEVVTAAWNATGASLAAAYGRNDHSDWCTHRGVVVVWHVHRCVFKQRRIIFIYN